MNIKTIISIILTVIILVATISLLFFANNSYGNSQNENGNKQTKYVVKYLDGEVVLLKNDSVIEKFEDINFDLLPTEDKLLLEDGIIVSSKAEAHTLIEDYDG